MLEMPSISKVPLRSAFRHWARRGVLEKAYELKIRMEIAEKGGSEECYFAIQFGFWITLAHETAWGEIQWGLHSVTGLRMPVTAESKRENIPPSLLKQLTPDFGRSSARNNDVEFVEIEISGPPPLWAHMGLDDMVWGPMYSEFKAEDEYRVVTLKKERFTLGKKQARVMRLLHAAHLRGEPDVAIKMVMHKARCGGHISDLFKEEKRKLIRFPAIGRVLLNVGA